MSIARPVTRRALRHASIGAGLALVLCVGVAPGIGTAGAEPTVQFRVQVLEASNAGRQASPLPPDVQLDEQLRQVLPRLRHLFRYAEYRVLARQRIDSPMGVQQRFPVSGQCWLEVTPERLMENRVRMRVRLREGNTVGLDAGLLVLPGAPAVLGGVPVQDGVLIVILWTGPPPIPR